MTESFVWSPSHEDHVASVCELCEREGARLTRHHLIPRARHRRGRTRRRYGLAECRERILLLCRACHKQIHAVLSEHELADQYATRERLLAHPDIRKFVEWIRGKPPGFTPRTYSMKRR